MFKKKLLAVCVAAVLPLMVGCDSDDDNVTNPPTPIPPPVDVVVGPQDFTRQWDTDELGFAGNFTEADHEKYTIAADGAQTVTFWLRMPTAASIYNLTDKGNGTDSNTDGWSVFTSGGLDLDNDGTKDPGLFYRTKIAGVKSDLVANFSGKDMDEWHHFVGIIDQTKETGELRGWIDGEEIDATSGEYDALFVKGELNTNDAIRIRQMNSGSINGGYLFDDYRIYDRALSTDEVQSFINVNNETPVAEITLKDNGTRVFTLSGDTSSDPENEVLKYIWDLGDGTLQYGQNIDKEYPYAGNYTVKLMVVDPWGKKSVVEETLTVDGEPNPLRKTVVYNIPSEGYASFRIPTIIKAGNGDLLAFAEGRKNASSDHGDIDVVMKRSTDDGQTWSPLQIVYDNGGTQPWAAQNVSAVYDETYEQVDNEGQSVLDANGKQTMGRMLIMWNNTKSGEAAIAGDHDGDCQNGRDALYKTSIDHGATWSEAVTITDQVRVDNQGGDRTQGQCMQVPPTGHAIQLTTDTARAEGRYGRLFFAGQYNPVTPGSGDGTSNENYAYWSDDHGKTWEIGGLIQEERLNEVQAIELANGDIMFNSRNYRGDSGWSGPKKRAITISKDGGTTFGETIDDDNLIEPIVAASIIRYTREDKHDKNRILFSHPNSTDSRINLTVKMSEDEGKTWKYSKLVNQGSSSYSDMVIEEDMGMGVLYETNENISYASFTLDWLTDGADTLKK